MSRAKWLEERRKGIGGSDAAAIVGLSKYATPFSVWADKTGQLPEKEDTEQMRQGRDFEHYVAQRFTELTGKRVRRKNGIIHSNIYPFALANVDRLVIGELAGLECKTTSVLNMKRFKNGEFPSEYYCQCVHYMAVTGLRQWYLAVLVLNQCFMMFEIKRDEDEISALMSAEKDFWEQYVLAGTPPPVDGRPPTSEALNKVFCGCSGDDEIDITHLSSDIQNWIVLKEQKKLIDAEIELIEQKIKLELKENSVAHCGDFTATWKAQTRRSINKKLLLEAYPKMDLTPFENVSVFRKFSIKEAK